MGFFAEFSAWLGTLLTTYIGDSTALVAAALEPAVITLGALYVIVWGYLQLTGQLEMPLLAGLKRIFMLGVILAVGLRLWLYNSVIVDTVYLAPGELAAQVVGASDAVSIVDQIIFDGGDAANLLLQKAGIFDGNWAYYLAGFFVYLAVGLTAIYTIFLLSLARIALSVLLALGPLFIALLLFDTTKRFFESWLAQLANYALITILTGLVAALMLTMLSTVARQAVAEGDGIQIAHGVRLCMAAGLIFLVMRQVMPMAASLASGLALSTYGTVSNLMLWAFSRSTRKGSDFVRGMVLDRETSRWDSLSRKSGYLIGSTGRAGLDAMTARWRRNSVRRDA